MRVAVLQNKHDRSYDWSNLIKQYPFEIVFVDGFDNLTIEDNLIGLVGYEPNIFKNKTSLAKIKTKGIKYLVTKSTGYDHLDLSLIKSMDIRVANIKAYSPSAISELTVGLLLNLVRNIPMAFIKNNHYNFTVDHLAPELKSLKVAIIGLGAIGKQTAKIIKGFGADILGYDLYEDEHLKDILTYSSLKEIKKEADVIIVHLPSIPEFYHFINDEFIGECLKRPFIINTARGELVDGGAIIKAIKNHSLRGYGADVYEYEQGIFFNAVDDLKDEVLKEMLSLYPYILLTPHMGATTIDACFSMMKLSLDNMQKFIEGKECEDEL